MFVRRHQVTIEIEQQTLLIHRRVVSDSASVSTAHETNQAASANPEPGISETYALEAPTPDQSHQTSAGAELSPPKLLPKNTTPEIAPTPAPSSEFELAADSTRTPPQPTEGSAS